jgi:hypothetical protein
MATLRWYREDSAYVREQLRQGARPELAMPTAVGPLDELVALHDELGAFAALGALDTCRARAGLAEELLLRTVAVLPFLGNGGFRPLADALLREPAVLLRLGWSPVQLRQGDNGQHRHPEGRQAESLPCHPDTLRDALARVGEQAWLAAQRAAVAPLFQRRLVRGQVYAIDGTGLGAEQRVVALVCVSAQHPLVVAWRYLEGSASEKGREAAVTRALVEQALAVGGPGCIGLLLADALYADGPLLAWLKYRRGIDALVRLPEDRLLYEDVQGLAAGGRLTWTEHRYLRTIRGHKQPRTVALAGVGHLDSWASFREAAAGHGAPDATLWACLIREVAPDPQALAEARALVSTRDWPAPAAAFQAFRGRWAVEDDTFRELKEGWGLEQQRWGTQAATVRGRVALTPLAFNTTQLYRTQAGARLAQRGIRRLRQAHRRAWGPRRWSSTSAGATASSRWKSSWRCWAHRSAPASCPNCVPSPRRWRRQLDIHSPPI